MDEWASLLCAFSTTLQVVWAGVVEISQVKLDPGHRLSDFSCIFSTECVWDSGRLKAEIVKKGFHWLCFTHNPADMSVSSACVRRKLTLLTIRTRKFHRQVL